MKITDRRNTLKTRAFKSNAWRSEKSEKKCHWEIYSLPHVLHTNCSCYSLTFEITTQSSVYLPWRELSTDIISFVLFHMLERLVPLYRLLLLLPLCSQQPFRVFCGGGKGELGENTILASSALFHTLEWLLPLCMLLLLSGLMLKAAI